MTLVVIVFGDIAAVETIAIGREIRELRRLQKVYGKGRWRKLKGIAKVRMEKHIFTAEVHWYEAHGIGKKELKVKRVLA